jgi:hypothetical protein
MSGFDYDAPPGGPRFDLNSARFDYRIQTGIWPGPVVLRDDMPPGVVAIVGAKETAVIRNIGDPPLARRCGAEYSDGMGI